MIRALAPPTSSKRRRRAALVQCTSSGTRQPTSTSPAPRPQLDAACERQPRVPPAARPWPDESGLTGHCKIVAPPTAIPLCGCRTGCAPDCQCFNSPVRMTLVCPGDRYASRYRNGILQPNTLHDLGMPPAWPVVRYVRSYRGGTPLTDYATTNSECHRLARWIVTFAATETAPLWLITLDQIPNATGSPGGSLRSQLQKRHPSG